jgi:hypothetical protein
VVVHMVVMLRVLLSIVKGTEQRESHIVSILLRQKMWESWETNIWQHGNVFTSLYPEHSPVDVARSRRITRPAQQQYIELT